MVALQMDGVRDGWVIPMAPEDVLLEVTKLKKYFPVQSGFLSKPRGYVKAVDDVSFRIKPRETLSLVGESGCGKTTVGYTILRLLEPTAGKILFENTDILSLGQRDLQRLRNKMQFIFQDPYSSLNSRMTVASIVGEPLDVHKLVNTEKEKNERIAAMLTRVGLGPEHMKRYPHEFSGGQRQRIGIARALMVHPRLIVADEPISSLDVSIQAQIINLLKDLQSEFGLTYLFISHNLSVVKHISDRVAVMYLGKIVEMAAKKDLFERPLHPYTRSLLSAIPIPDPLVKRKRILLQGDVPSPVAPPAGCRFHPRCPEAIERCGQQEPQWIELEAGHFAACHFSG